MELQSIAESNFEVDTQELIDKLLQQNHFLEKRCKYLKRRRDLLLQTLSYINEPKSKLAESKISEGNLSTQPDDNDLHLKYQEDLQEKNKQIMELNDKVETLQNQVKTLQLCNDEMQYKLQQQQQQQKQQQQQQQQPQQQEFVRNNHVSQTVIIPKSTSQTEKAQAVIEKFGQNITTSSFKSTDGKPLTSEERKKQLKRLSLGAGASAYMMAMKGDYTTLIGASEEVKSERSIEL